MCVFFVNALVKSALNVLAFWQLSLNLLQSKCFRIGLFIPGFCSSVCSFLLISVLLHMSFNLADHLFWVSNGMAYFLILFWKEHQPNRSVFTRIWNDRIDSTHEPFPAWSCITAITNMWPIDETKTIFNTVKICRMILVMCYVVI